MLTLYFGGAEIPGWRKLLADQGVTHVSMSFVGLLRRTRLVRPWRIDDKFPEDMAVFLDSGGYTLNRNPEKYTVEDLHELAHKYRDFVETNYDRIEMVTEFDALVLGQDWIERERSSFWEGLGDKWWPIWHAETGIAELERLAATYGRVGVPQTSVGGRDIIPVLNRLARDGVRLHGVAMTKTTLLEEVAFSSVASTSWLSPAQYGDTQIWTGTELKRYPRKYKDQGRKRHRQYLAQQGFDTDAIEADDHIELLKVAIWSWQQYVSNLNRGGVVSISPDWHNPENRENCLAEVDTRSSETGTEVSTRRPFPRERRQLLPGVVLDVVTRPELGEDGQTVDREEHRVGVDRIALRQCDSCYISSRCPAFVPHAQCGYEIPVQLKTRDQLDAARRAVLAMQLQRVMFMRLIEETEGGYSDPNLTKEIELFNRMASQLSEEDAESVSISIRARARADAETGMIGRLFGREAAEQARALPQPVQSDDVIQHMGIVDADVIAADD